MTLPVLLQSPSIAGKGEVLLATATAINSDTVDFAQDIDGTFGAYALRWRGVRGTLALKRLWIRLRIDGAWEASLYRYVGYRAAFGLALAIFGSNSASAIRTTDGAYGSAATDTAQGHMRFYDPTGPKFKGVDCSLSYLNVNSNPVRIGVSGYHPTAGVLSGVRFLMSAGQIAEGEFSLHGITTD